ncbi:MAG: MFS transporter [Nitrospira sp.]|nr:MFS transporter [Nitrospira sp.]MBX3342231.1 MFS transporter [Nitrospira sp.]MBX3371695.1 MFS transporter [Nitrospira sp.]MBX7039521.1 MFS transporter [Nitrospira sp.]MCW5796175.1 MFS transporter [Nitrospira sp.]
MSDDHSTPDSSRGWRLICTRDFGLLWWGQTTSQIGEGLNKVALLWFVYELTGSAMKMTMVGLLQTIPPLVLGPLVGVYLDRMPKKPVMIWVDILRALLTLLIPTLYALDMLSITGLYGIIFLTSVVSTIFGPALVSAVPLLVRPSELMSANALIQGTNNIGMLLGPAISGIMIALIRAENVLFVNSATFLISALCLMPIRFSPSHAVSSEQATSVWQELQVGFRFIFGQQSMVLTLVIISSLYNLGVSAFVFILPVYAKEFLQVGPVQLGWLWSALGVGMLAASAWLALKQESDIQGRLRIVVSGMTIGGLAVCSLSLLETPLIAAGIVIIVGGSTAVLNPIIWALLQELTPEHLIGRVVTTFSVGSMASAMAGMTGFGWVADAVGPAASLVALGLVLLLTAAVAVACVRRTCALPVAHA